MLSTSNLLSARFESEAGAQTLVLERRYEIAAGLGYVDTIERRGRVLTIEGWAATEAFDPPDCIVVAINGEIAATSDFRQFERPDVTEHFRLDRKVKTGFRIRTHAEGPVNTISVVAVFPSGRAAELSAAVQYAEQRNMDVLTVAEDAVWLDKFSVPLLPYPEDSPFAGIFTTSSLGFSGVKGVTRQFLEDAGTYHKKYFSSERWRNLLGTALNRAGLECPPLSVLDLGSGSGNSVIPALELLPNATVVATDISPQLLAILNSFLSEQQRRRCRLVVSDAADDCFQPESFDIVIGAAILHHLFDPAQAVASAFKALRKGGCAIFFEPFEAGNGILCCLYETLLSRRIELKLSDDVVRLFQALLRDYDARVHMDKSDPMYESMDDKWMFTRRYFERLRDRIGFSALQIYPLDGTEGAFTRAVTTYLRLGAGCGPESLPPPAWDVVKQYDARFTEDLRPDLLVEGCVIFTK